MNPKFDAKYAYRDFGSKTIDGSQIPALIKNL